jgi:hypothetical protein
LVDERRTRTALLACPRLIAPPRPVSIASNRTETRSKISTMEVRELRQIARIHSFLPRQALTVPGFEVPAEVGVLPGTCGAI